MIGFATFVGVGGNPRSVSNPEAVYGIWELATQTLIPRQDASS